jgi:large conductance mechanosensitive channel
MLKGFKDFIMKGNVLDLAVAVIIGAAFTTVVNALVNSVLMPFISGLVGSPNFDSFAAVNFNGNQIQFGVLLLIAAAVYFAIVLPMNKMIERRNRRLGITPEQSADPQVMLLTEIRDALTSQPPNGTAQSQEGPKH